jgi:hypothetical protein
MHRRFRAFLALAYAALTAALMALPLVQTLHAESAAMVALAGFWVAGLSSVAALRRGAAARALLLGHLALLLIPAAGLTVSLFWAPNRGYGQGALLYLTFAAPSVVLGVALARLVARWARPYAALVGIGMTVLIATPLWDLGLHPQFYHYNHVFGGVLGPIYDETLALRPGLFAFRGLTLLWAALAWTWAAQGRSRRSLALAATIALCYLLGPWLGLTTPGWRTQQVLGSHAASAHLDLYYSAAHTTEVEANRLLLEAEFEYARLATLFGARPEQRVQIYLYPDPQTRGALTGAAYTNVAPVWLPDPQIHVVRSAWSGVLGHELAHVFARPFGLPWIRASARVGLVEGLAGAAEPPDGLPSPSEQVAARLGQVEALAERLAATLGAGGFWGGRGAVSYTTTASFVQFVADRYGWPAVLDAYAWGDLERTTGVPIGRLAEQWREHLSLLAPIPVQAAPLSARRFSAPSLFEKPSPHWTPRHVRLTRAADRALLPLRADTTAALDLLTQALRSAPTYAPAQTRRADLLLRHHRPGEVVRAFEAAYATTRPDTARIATGVLRLWADALAVQGEIELARSVYDQLVGRHRLIDAPEAVLRLRLHRLAMLDGSTGAVYGALPRRGAGALLWAIDHLDRPEALDLLSARTDLPWSTPGERRIWEGYRAYYASESAWRLGRYAESAEWAELSGAWFGQIGYLPGQRLARWQQQRAEWAPRHLEAAQRVTRAADGGRSASRLLPGERSARPAERASAPAQSRAERQPSALR